MSYRLLHRSQPPMNIDLSLIEAEWMHYRCLNFKPKSSKNSCCRLTTFGPFVSQIVQSTVKVTVTFPLFRDTTTRLAPNEAFLTSRRVAIFLVGIVTTVVVGVALPQNGHTAEVVTFEVIFLWTHCTVVWNTNIIWNALFCIGLNVNIPINTFQVLSGWCLLVTEDIITTL